MSKSDIEKIKGNYTIVCSDHYVVAHGKNLYVFTLTGVLQCCRSDIMNVYKVAFLQNHTLLVDTGKHYYLISLIDGTDIWKVKLSPREINSPRFAISRCETYAYNFYLNKGYYYLEKINLKNVQIEVYPLDNELRTLNDIQCEQNGEPALLRSHYSVIAGKRVSENGIGYPCHEPFGNGGSYYWKNKWQIDGARISYAFWENTESVITNDLHIFYHITGKTVDLLENEILWKPPEFAPFAFNTDNSKRFLVLCYSKFNVVIDLNNRCVVAKYNGEYTSGCIVDKEFWISSASGVLRKPFPLCEEISASKNNVLGL